MSNIHCFCLQGKMKTDEREMTATSNVPPVVRMNSEKKGCEKYQKGLFELISQRQTYLAIRKKDSNTNISR